MPETPATQPEPGAEPQWPEYVRRTDQWDVVEYGQGVCACRWLEVLESQESLFGGISGRVGRCPDCGAIFDWCA